jgi:hypothetical protein
MFSSLSRNVWSRTLYATRCAARNIKSTAFPVTPTTGAPPEPAAPTAAPTAAAARLAAVDENLAVLQAKRAVLQAAVFAETFPAWARERAAEAAATGSFRLDGDAGLRGLADVLAAHMVAPPTVTRYEETKLGKSYQQAWQYIEVTYAWDGESIHVSQATNFSYPNEYRTTPRDNTFMAQLSEWSDARKENDRATLELRDIPEHFWLALVEVELL